MRIGELAIRAGCNIETVRFYERSGLMPEPGRTASGHRVYGHRLLQRLVFIRRARDLDFSLENIRELLLHVDRDDVDCADVQSFAVGHLERIEHRIADLDRMRRALKSLMADCQSDGPGCAIIDALFDAGYPLPVGGAAEQA